MSSPPACFEIQGRLEGERLCDECHGQYAVWRVRMGLVLRGLCGPCARELGGEHYVQSKGVSDWHARTGTRTTETAETTGPPTTTERDHDNDKRRNDEQVGEQTDRAIEHSLRSEEEFPTRAREYLDVLEQIRDDIGLDQYAVTDMFRCFYKVQGHACRCEQDHHTAEFRRDKKERTCPRCNRAYRYRMAEEMVSLARDFECTFYMRFVFTVPSSSRDIDLQELLERIYRTLRSYFSEADINGFYAIPHEFSSSSPPTRNPHVEIFMLPIGLRRTWLKDYQVSIDGSKVRIQRLVCRECRHHWDKVYDLVREKERCPECKCDDVERIKTVRIDELLRYQKWMLTDEEIDDLRRELYELRARRTLDVGVVTPITMTMMYNKIAKLETRLTGSKRLEDVRKIWRREFPDAETELNVHYSYVDLEKAQRHTIPYALRPPFNPEYVVNFDGDVVVYQAGDRTSTTIELSLEDVLETFRYEYYDPRRHRIHRLGFLSNAFWRHYYRALTGNEPPEDEEGSDVLRCPECEGRVLEIWTNDHGWYEWIQGEFLDGVEVHLFSGDDASDFYAWVHRNMPVALTTKRSKD